MDIPVAYGEDLDQVIEVVNRVGIELAQDDYFKTLIKTPPQFLRVENFGASGIDIRILGETRSMYRREVMGELRKRLKKAFDLERIEIPWPHTKLYFSEKQLNRFLDRG
jgi:small conductance mechanosensitive channel